MKKFKWWWGVGAVIVLCAAVLTIRACKITDSYSKLKGEYSAYRKIAEEDAKVSAAKIAEQETAIGELDKKITASTNKVGQLTNALGQKDKDLSALRESWAGLSTECQANLRALDAKWSEKFSLLESVVAEKDKQLAGWAAKFAAQGKISDEWKAQYEAEHRLRLSGETLLGKLETKYKVLRLTSSVKSMVVIAAAGFVGYTLLKKGK